MSRQWTFVVLAAAFSVTMVRGQVSSHDRRVMAHSAHVRLFQIAAAPVEKAKQDSTRHYILDYEITRSLLLPDSLRRLFRHALGDSASYISGGISRQCEFLPAYAVRLSKDYQALISTGVCPKIGLYSRRSGKTVFCDLVDNSRVEQVLKSAN